MGEAEAEAEAAPLATGETAAAKLRVLRPPPRLIVLTGGSGVGKTTLIERLAALGYPTVPAAAMPSQCDYAMVSPLNDGELSQTT